VKPLALAGTVLLHAALAAALLVRCTPAIPSEPPKKAESQQERKPIEIRLLPAGEEGDNYCDSSYTGIGVMVSRLDGHIIDVAPGSPADRAGVKEGDIYLNADEFPPDSLKPGSRITLRIQRAGRTFNLQAVIGRVCYSGEGHP
jgi:predicted metalloprotease with PDZ domain